MVSVLCRKEKMCSVLLPFLFPFDAFTFFSLKHKEPAEQTVGAIHSNMDGAHPPSSSTPIFVDSMFFLARCLYSKY